MTAIPETSQRVRKHSPQKANERINSLIRLRVRDLAERLDAIDKRLAEIDREWDIERSLQANAATITLLSLILGSRWPRLRFLPLVVAGFLLQHAVQGWCPPIPLMRRLGIRTMAEIDRERYALKALRGDFEEIAKSQDPKFRTDAALQAASYHGGNH